MLTMWTDTQSAGSPHKQNKAFEGKIFEEAGTTNWLNLCYSHLAGSLGIFTAGENDGNRKQEGQAQVREQSSALLQDSNRGRSSQLPTVSKLYIFVNCGKIDQLSPLITKYQRLATKQ